MPPDATVTYTVELKEFTNVRTDMRPPSCFLLHSLLLRSVCMCLSDSIHTWPTKTHQQSQHCLLPVLQAKDTWAMSDEEKVEAAAARKEKGNARFKAGSWAAALAKYKVCDCANMFKFLLLQLRM